MGLCTLGNDVPIGCRLRETEGRLRRPLIHLALTSLVTVHGGKKLSTLVFISSVDPPCFSAIYSKQARPDPFHTAHHMTGQLTQLQMTCHHVRIQSPVYSCITNTTVTRSTVTKRLVCTAWGVSTQAYYIWGPASQIFRRLLSATVGATMLSPPEKRVTIAISVFRTGFQL